MSNNSATELQNLWLRASHGDRAAWDEFVRLAWQKLYGFLWRRGFQDVDVVEDAIVKTLELFLKKYNKELGNAEAFLFKLAYHRAVDISRLRQVRQTVPLPEGDSDPASQAAGRTSSSPERWLETKEELERLAKCLEHLPNRERTVLELRFWSELKLPEIAEKLNLSLSIVKRLSASAIHNMSRCMGL